MSSSTIDYPAFERPDLTFNIVPQNLDPNNIEVGLYQDILKGDLLNTYNDNMDLSISRKIVSLLPKEHDLYIEKGFIEKTDKDPYQIYSDTDSAYVLIKLPFNKSDDLKRTVDYCQNIAIRLNNVYGKLLDLYWWKFGNWHPDFNTMNFKSEVIAFRGFYGAKKFYGLGKVWEEGRFFSDKLKLKTTGGQIRKSDVTQVTKEMLKEIYEVLCLNTKITDLKELYTIIFKKIKNKYTLKLREAIQNMDAKYFDIPKKWSFGEKKNVPMQIIGAKLYNRIIKDTFNVGDSVSVIQIKCSYKLLQEEFMKHTIVHENMLQNEELNNKINYISIPTKISDEEKDIIFKRFADLGIQIDVDTIINFNIDMKLEPYKKLFPIDIQRSLQ